MFGVFVYGVNIIRGKGKTFFYSVQNYFLPKTKMLSSPLTPPPLSSCCEHLRGPPFKQLSIKLRE